MKKKIMIVLGYVSAGLWLWSLISFLGLKEVGAGVVMFWLGLGWIVPSILLLCGYSDNNVDGVKMTGHKCDLCKASIPVGEGLHYPPQGSRESCYCVCEKCKPNVSSLKV